MHEDPDVPRVWLFTRDPESVWLSVQPGPAGYRLAIFGPDAASAEFDFADLDNLERFREKYVEDLTARGFVPAALAERPGSREPMPQSGNERRR